MCVEIRVLEIKQDIIEFVTCHYPAIFIVTFLFGKFNAQENSRMTRVCLHIYSYIQHNITYERSCIMFKREKTKLIFSFFHSFLFPSILQDICKGTTRNNLNAIYVEILFFWMAFFLIF